MSQIIGIDLGTTNSVVSYYKDGRVKVLSLEGHTTTPSVLLFDGDKIEVGHKAKNRMAIVPEKILESTKRDMGKDVVYHKEGKDITPMKAASLILKKLKQMAEAELNDVVNDVVITVPAYFGTKAKNATYEAALNAGLKPLLLVPEPVAAAICYAQNRQSEQTLVVVDLGGGTFDVAVLHYHKENEEPVYEVLGTPGGDPCLGGVVFDRCIVDWLIKEEGAKGFKDKLELQVYAEKAKIDLASADVAEIDCPFVKTTLSRDQYKNLIKDYLKQICDTIKTTVANSGKSLDEIDRYILVGGSCKHPIIRETIAECVGKEPFASTNLDTVVAEGAAWNHHMLTTPHPHPGIVKTVCSMSLGTDVYNYETGVKFNAILIKAGTKLPTQVASIAFIQNGQHKLVSGVCEGDKEKFDDNNLLDSIEINLKYSGEHVVITVFKLDNSGILSFETYEIEIVASLLDDIEALCNNQDKKTTVIDWDLWTQFYAKHKSHIEKTYIELNLDNSKDK
ncbi:MAG: Hsp70 family protein [Rikenellaceae bacterium]|nr:Hsp70 family protein [Rikenellaceae bacterium]